MDQGQIQARKIELYNQILADPKLDEEIKQSLKDELMQKAMEQLKKQ